jgi:hypothetical protein
MGDKEGKEENKKRFNRMLHSAAIKLSYLIMPMK